MPEKSGRLDLKKSELETIVELENEMGVRFPVVKKIKEDTFGIVVEGGHVVGLGFYDKNLKNPVHIESFPRLKILNLIMSNAGEGVALKRADAMEDLELIMAGDKIKKLTRNYRGHETSFTGKLGLQDLENALGEPIPKVGEIKDDTFGFILKDKKVVGLGLYDKELSSHSYIPEGFNHLRILNLSRVKGPKYLPSYHSGLEELNLSYTNLNDQYHFGSFQRLKKLILIGVSLNEKELHKISTTMPFVIEEVPRTPYEIYKSVVNDRTPKAEAIDTLMMIVENCDSSYYRIDALKKLEILGLEEERVLKIVERSLISDENEPVRLTALDVVFRHLPEFGTSPIEWSIQNERSERCLKAIYREIKDRNTEEAKILFDIIKEKIGRPYNSKFGISLHEGFGLGLLKLYTQIEPVDYRENTQEWNYITVVVNNSRVINLTLDTVGEHEVNIEGYFPFLNNLRIQNSHD